MTQLITDKRWKSEKISSGVIRPKTTRLYGKLERQVANFSHSLGQVMMTNLGIWTLPPRSKKSSWNVNNYDGVQRGELTLDHLLRCLPTLLITIILANNKWAHVVGWSGTFRNRLSLWHKVIQLHTSWWLFQNIRLSTSATDKLLCASAIMKTMGL